MRDNFEQQKYELLQLRGGHWPSGRNEVSIERMAAQFLGLGIGVCGVYPFEVAETKVDTVIRLARENGHPLKCTMEKE